MSVVRLFPAYSGCVGMNLSAVKDLALSYSARQLEQCLSNELSSGCSVCQLPFLTNNREMAIDSLAKAQVVREYMEMQKVSYTDALRELARRMRTLQETSVSP